MTTQQAKPSQPSPALELLRLTLVYHHTAAGWAYADDLDCKIRLHSRIVKSGLLSQIVKSGLHSLVVYLCQKQQVANDSLGHVPTRVQGVVHWSARRLPQPCCWSVRTVCSSLRQCIPMCFLLELDKRVLRLCK
jgi:hypothetical protein